MVRRGSTQWLNGDQRFIELMQALAHPEERWTYPEQPDILASLDELTAWTNDSRDYDKRIHKSGWLSATRDFFDAAASLGSNTMQAVKPHVDAIRGICQPDVGGDPALRASLVTETAAMRQALGNVATLGAAWTDLVRVCSRKESSTNTVATRRDTFWAIVRATDRNTDELSRNLCMVLTGDPVETAFARSALGEIQEIDSDGLHSLRDTPLTSPAERLELVNKLLGTEPTSRAHVVWFAFRRASMNSMGQQLNSIQFFDAQWLHGNLFEGGPFKDQLPSELSDLDHETSIPNKPDVVMARVDLGIGIFSDAIRVAGERLDALLGISTLGCPVPWERMRGFIHAQDGQIMSHRYFVYDDEQVRSRHVLDYTANQMSRMAPRVAPLIPIEDPSLKGIIDALHWWRTGIDQPTAASVVLNVRVIELVASRVGETSWTTYLEKFMKNLWIRDTILNTLYFAFQEALHRRVAPDAVARQREISLGATTYERGEQRTDIRKVARYLDEVIGFTEDNLPLGRELRTIKRKTSSAQAMQAWCSELERTWGGCIHRLERVRNSVAHGGPFTEQAVLLAQPFSQKISVWALWESVEGFLEGKALPESHEDLRSRLDQWRASVRTMSSIDGIFGDS